MYARHRHWGLVLLASLLLLTGCTTMKPLDPSSNSFLNGRCYARTDYQTTFYTERGELIVAPPNRAHIHDLGDGRTLVLWFDKIRSIRMSDIRAFTFNTAIELHTNKGEVFKADSGEWWFILHDGKADMWMKTPSPNPPIDYHHAISVAQHMVSEIDVETRSPLIPVAYGVSVIAAGLAVVLFVSITGAR